MDRTEQRRTPRFAVRQEIQVVRGEDRSVGTTVNMSLGGACIEAALDPPCKIGDRVRVSFRIPSLDQPVEADAVVRWRSDADDDVIGIQYTTGFRAKTTFALGVYFDGLAKA